MQYSFLVTSPSMIELARDLSDETFLSSVQSQCARTRPSLSSLCLPLSRIDGAGAIEWLVITDTYLLQQ